MPKKSRAPIAYGWAAEEGHECELSGAKPRTLAHSQQTQGDHSGASTVFPTRGSFGNIYQHKEGLSMGLPWWSRASAYLWLLIFLPAILILACASSSPAFHMMYSAYKLNKQGDNTQP